MKIQFQLEQKDILAFNEYYYNKNTPFIQKHLRWILLTIFLIYMIFTFREPITVEVFNWANWVILLFTGGVLYYLGFRKLQSREKVIIKFIKDNPETVGSREIELLDDSVIYKTESSKTEYQYNSFKNIEAAKEYYLIYLSQQNALVVPERAFDNRQHFEEFKRVIENKRIPTTE